MLDNAVKFTPRDGSITVTVAAEPDVVEIAVRDTGPGVPPEELERATDRFWRSPGHSSVDGSGLGLAIAARTVELAGGEMLLSLPDGGGLRIAARLPRVARGAGRAPAGGRGRPAVTAGHRACTRVRGTRTASAASTTTPSAPSVSGSGANSGWARNACQSSSNTTPR